MENSEQKLKRLQEAFAYLLDIGKVHKQQDLANDLGMSRSRVSDALKGMYGKFTDGFLRRFAAAYKDHISERWLLEGTGRMDIPGPDEKPHVESIQAAAGYLGGIPESVKAPGLRKITDLMPAYDYTIRASGDSMLPEIQSGDILLCRNITRQLLKSDIGHIFIFDTPDGISVKRLAEISPDGILTLHSLNPDYSDYTADAATLNTLSRVVAVLHPIL